MEPFSALQCVFRAGQTNFAAGPGPVPGTAGGFRDPGMAAMTGMPVVGPGHGPGAVKATPGVTLLRANVV